jgi:hypothetical protein
MNSETLSAIPLTLSGVFPVDNPMPALSNKMTRRSAASALTTAGSQSSMVPWNRWQKTSGTPPAGPNADMSCLS